MIKRISNLCWILVLGALSFPARAQPESFPYLLEKASKTDGFRMEGYWVWCGSALRGDDGKYHLFASRWPKKYPFNEGYVFYSEVVHAVASRPEGPYEYRETVLPARGENHWDGRMTHNPTVLKYKDFYYLFYIGSTYAGPDPDTDSLRRIKAVYRQKAYKNIRIGVARSRSLNGPWERRNAPVLSPDPQGWDSVVVTNPAPCLDENGSVRLIYRTFVRGKGNRLAWALANHPDSAFVKQGNGPIAAAEVEDPFVWKEGPQFQMLAKDLSGNLTGEKHAGVFLTSTDFARWMPAKEPKAWSRKMAWDTGDSTVLGSLERPQLLFENGKPTWIFFAAADGPGGFLEAKNTWNQAVRLRRKSVVGARSEKK